MIFLFDKLNFLLQHGNPYKGSQLVHSFWISVKFFILSLQYPYGEKVHSWINTSHPGTGEKLVMGQAQRVIANRVTSGEQLVNSGIYQVSILSTVFFNIFIYNSDAELKFCMRFSLYGVNLLSILNWEKPFTPSKAEWLNNISTY